MGAIAHVHSFGIGVGFADFNGFGIAGASGFIFITNDVCHGAFANAIASAVVNENGVIYTLNILVTITEIDKF